MTKEQYVTYETAKLLKEKGFPQNTSICNVVYKPNGKMSFNAKSFINPHYLFKDWYIFAPTQHMACDWVEKTYGFFIEIFRSVDLNGNYHYFYIILDKTCKYASSATRDNDYSSKSDVIEAALKYILNNLI